MVRFLPILFFIFCLLLAAGCSPSEKSSKKGNEDETYVFDEIPIEEEPVNEKVKNYVEYNYFIQLGAFATEHNAELYASQCTEYISEELEVVYNDITNLYVVRIKSFFHTQLEAERVRDRIRKNEKFLDAWIGKIKR